MSFDSELVKSLERILLIQVIHTEYIYIAFKKMAVTNSYNHYELKYNTDDQNYAGSDFTHFFSHSFRW